MNRKVSNMIGDGSNEAELDAMRFEMSPELRSQFGGSLTRYMKHRQMIRDAGPAGANWVTAYQADPALRAEFEVAGGIEAFVAFMAHEQRKGRRS